MEQRRKVAWRRFSTKAEKHTSRDKRPSGLNEDTSDSNTEFDDEGDVNADSECDKDTDSGDSGDSSTDGIAKVAAIAPTALTTATDAVRRVVDRVGIVSRMRWSDGGRYSQP